VNGSARLRLQELLEHLRRRTIDVEMFCTEFERIYNLELDKDTLTPSEAKVFSALFEHVIWYSPFEEERKQVPNYASEEDIKAAAERAAAELGSGPRN
jgi:hypothetical protein